MQTYTCPTCGEKMERDLSLFMEHTDKHIVEEVKKKNPTWVTKDGFCPKCVDHFKKALHDPGALAQETNLDAGGVLQRALLGLAGFGAAIGVFLWLENIHAPQIARLFLFPLYFLGLLGYLQAKKKVCVVIAQGQAEEMRRKAAVILLVAIALAALLTVASYFFSRS